MASYEYQLPEGYAVFKMGLPTSSDHPVDFGSSGFSSGNFDESPRDLFKHSHLLAQTDDNALGNGFTDPNDDASVHLQPSQFNYLPNQLTSDGEVITSGERPKRKPKRTRTVRKVLRRKPATNKPAPQHHHVNGYSSSFAHPSLSSSGFQSDFLPTFAPSHQDPFVETIRDERNVGDFISGTIDSERYYTPPPPPPPPPPTAPSTTTTSHFNDQPYNNDHSHRYTPASINEITNSGKAPSYGGSSSSYYQQHQHHHHPGTNSAGQYRHPLREIASTPTAGSSTYEPSSYNTFPVSAHLSVTRDEREVGTSSGQHGRPPLTTTSSHDNYNAFPSQAGEQGQANYEPQKIIINRPSEAPPPKRFPRYRNNGKKPVYHFGGGEEGRFPGSQNAPARNTNKNPPSPFGLRNSNSNNVNVRPPNKRRKRRQRKGGRKLPTDPFIEFGEFRPIGPSSDDIEYGGFVPVVPPPQNSHHGRVQPSKKSQKQRRKLLDQLQQPASATLSSSRG